jgi:phage/plasmid-like protein (TIGR03299 family)
MAHQVEQMAYVGRTPWHGLGNKLPERQPLEVWMEQAGLDWSIHETPVRFINTNKGHLGEILSFDDHKVLYRSDTHAPLSVVSQRYQVVQPREIMEFYRDLTEKSGFELETAGSLKGGRKIWALARTGQSGVLKGCDRSDAYVLLATACDGTLATTAQFTSIRVVCNNTLAVALDGQSQCVKVSHRSVFDAEAVKKQMGISVSVWDDFMYSLKTLSERKVKQSEAEKFIRSLFQPNPHQVEQKSNERAIGKVLALFDGQGRGSHLPSSRSTAYGLLNAVTEFVDHERRARSTDYRLDSAWFGQGATLKHLALNQSLELVA